MTQEQNIKIKNKIQSEACKAVVEKLRSNYKTILNLATGSGKTVTAAKISFNYLNEVNTVLFMVPKISLVNQTIEEWTNMGFAFEYETAYTSGNIKTAEDLIDFMNKPSLVKKVVFAVYNSVGVVNGTPSLFTTSGVEFDLAIYDECHRTAGTELGLFTSCVHDEVVKAKYKLFMTATIKIYTEDEENENVNEYSMANPSLYGEIAYSLTIFEAIKLGILCPFETYLLEVSNNRLRSMLNQELGYYGEFIKGRHLAAAYGVVNAYNQGARKILVMYREIQNAHDFNNLFNFMQRELGLFGDAIINCVASNVTATQLNAPREFIKNPRGAQKWFLKEGPFTTSNSAIVTSTPWIKEGEDVPCIDSIVFGDRFNSGIDIIQIIGRALRYYNGKEKAIIILPIVEGEMGKAARNIQATIANMQNNIEEFQIIRMENPINQNDQQSEVTTREVNQEDRQVRWAFNQDQTEATRFETNQGEFSMTLIQDNTMDSESRNQHDMMLQSIGLKLTNQYREYITALRAERFISTQIENVEGLLDGDVNTRSEKRTFRSNDSYISMYSEKYDLTIEEAKKELGDHLKKIDNLREKMLKMFF